MGWKKRMEDAKKGHRPSLRDWTQDGLVRTFPSWRQQLEQQQQQQLKHMGDSYAQVQMPVGSRHPPNLPAVVDGSRLSYEEFANDYESHGIPCVIRNVPEAEGWSATENWQLDRLERDEELLERKFKCGEDDDGKTIKVKLRHFLSYLRENEDDSPLYVFDSGFDDDKMAKRILSDYKVPSFFRDDLFRLVSESRRPPYRWWLVGPERSGTTVHIDPLNTSAWNTLIYGQKRWVLFPPQVPKSIVKGKGLFREGEDDEAIHYFMFILPRIKAKAAQMGNTGAYTDFACYEFTQQAGETCFIPLGWWHAVLNLTHTVGVTQNFCSPRNFPQVWEKTRTGRKKMAAKWLNQLDVHYPDLANQARLLNQRDGFVMKYDPEEVRRKDEEAKQRKEMKKYEAKMRAEYERYQQQYHQQQLQQQKQGSAPSHGRGPPPRQQQVPQKPVHPMMQYGDKKSLAFDGESPTASSSNHSSSHGSSRGSSQGSSSSQISGSRGSIDSSSAESSGRHGRHN